MTEKTTETGLEQRREESFELMPTTASAEAQHEIQSAIIIAKRFPRNEDVAFEKVMRACKRPSFASDAAYSFPRGGNRVTGPSINLAREAARAWGNVRFGLAILADDDDGILIQGWAWDVETNTKVTSEDRFKKLVQRKGRSGGTNWTVPDERDLRELINRRGAIAVRNCLLQILPKDLIEDALTASSETLHKEAKQDPDSARKRLILAFSALNVTPHMLTEYLQHPIAQCSPAEIVKLRGIYESIRDGYSTWAEEAGGSSTIREVSKGTLTPDMLRPGEDQEPPKKAKPRGRPKGSKNRKAEPEPKPVDEEPTPEERLKAREELDKLAKAEGLGGADDFRRATGDGPTASELFGGGLK